MVKLYFNDVDNSILMMDTLLYIERITPNTLEIVYKVNGNIGNWKLMYFDEQLLEKDLKRYANE